MSNETSDNKPDQSDVSKEEAREDSRSEQQHAESLLRWLIPGSDRGGEVHDKLTHWECSQAELKELAKLALPERLHDIVDRSEILSVSSAERRNEDVADHFRSRREDDSREKDYCVAQVPARENRAGLPPSLAIEMRLGADLPVGQVHGADEDGDPRIGRYFSEATADGRTQSEVKEQAVLPPPYGDKTHASSGLLKKDSVVILSEVSPRSYKLGDLKDFPTSRDAPPLAAELPVKAYQLELMGEPDACFEIEEAKPLEPDRWH